MRSHLLTCLVCHILAHQERVSSSTKDRLSLKEKKEQVITSNKTSSLLINAENFKTLKNKLSTQTSL